MAKSTDRYQQENPVEASSSRSNNATTQDSLQVLDDDTPDDSSSVDESQAESSREDIPTASPFELTLQSLLGAPLDTTVWSLRGLHDSQVALTTQLNLLMSTLESYRTGTRPVKLKETVVQIKESKQRLQAINTTLAAVEARIIRVRERLVTAVQPAEHVVPRRTLG